MIQIRKADSNDIDTIYSIANSYDETRLDYKGLCSDLNNSLYSIFVIEETNILGYLYICQAIDSIDIISLGIDKEYFRQGLASKLLNYLDNYSISKNIKDIFLEVDNKNIKAINCYIKAGYKQISVRKHYYSNGNDALIMKKELI